MAVAERKLDNTRQRWRSPAVPGRHRTNRSEAARRRTPTSSRRRFRWSSASADAEDNQTWRWTKPAWRSAVLLFPDFRQDFHRRGRSGQRGGPATIPAGRGDGGGAIPICGRRKRRWSSKLTRSNPPARALFAYTLVSIISSASMPTSSPCMTRITRITWARWRKAQLTVPLWTWGAARSKIRQAADRARSSQERFGFSPNASCFPTLQAFYQEAQVAGLADGFAQTFGRSFPPKACGFNACCATGRARLRCF